MQRRIVLVALVGIVASGSAYGVDVAVAVSPGEPARTARIDGRCPTFSWGAVSDAVTYEVVVYRVTEQGQEAEPVLQRSFPGSVTSWTPSLDACLSAEGQYAWSVRALGRKGAGTWSGALLFETLGGPTDEEVQQALRVLRRFRKGEGKKLPAKGPISSEGGQQRVERQPRRSVMASRPRDRLPEPLTSSTVGAGRSPTAVTTPSDFALSIDGDFDVGGFVFKSGAPFIHTENRSTAVGLNALESADTYYVGNSAFGYWALQNNTTGGYNTASGAFALHKNDTGRDNTASGYKSLYSNTTASYNTASGALALFSNTTGWGNTAIGFRALRYNTMGVANTANGYEALEASDVGNSNTAIGYRALFKNTGSLNTAIGGRAGYAWTTGSNNIAVGVGASGVISETATIRIGGGDFQTRTFIEGIRGATSGDPTGAGFDVAVCIDQLDQLGPCADSSLRFKQDIELMGDTTGVVRSLRPVKYRHRPREGQTAEQPLRYGLIAEEVAEVLPTLVTYDEDGLPRTVRYDLLTPLLLNEIHRQEAEMAEQKDELTSLRSQMADRDRQLADLRRQLEKLAKKKRFRDE